MSPSFLVNTLLILCLWSFPAWAQVMGGTGIPQPVINGDCIIGSGGVAIWGSCAGGAAVASVANSDGTLTISPTTGSVVASLALGHANHWTGAQTLDSPILVTPALGTPASGVATNLTGTAAGLTAGTVTTNANLTGPVTSVGNATTITAGGVTNAMLAGSIAASKLIGTDIATVGTLTAGATGSGFTIALSTSTITGDLPAARMETNFLAAMANQLTPTNNNCAVGNGSTWTSAACPGGGSGLTNLTINPGFTSTVGTQNTGTTISSGGSTVSPQLWPVTISGSCTVNSNCNGAVTNETGEELICGATATLTFPNPAAGTKGNSYAVGSDGTHACTLTTVGGSANFYGDLGSGTGATSYTVPTKTAIVIVDTGTAYNVATAGVSGVVPVSLGGTGLASGTSGGILGYTASGTLASSAALAVNGFVLGGGAGATPAASQITGLVKGNGASAPGAATAGTDYAAAPSGSTNTPLFNNGSGGFTNGTRTGNTTAVATTTGAFTSGNCVQSDANHNFVDSGGTCGGGGGGISCPTGFTAVNADCVWTITASGSTSDLQWTGLTGNNYELRCSGIAATSGTPVAQIQFGEGGTPTWGTGSNYVYQSTYTHGALLAASGSTSTGFFGFNIDTSSPVSLYYNFFGLSNSTQNKTATGNAAWVTGGVMYNITQSDYYTADTNPITAIRLDGSGTNFATSAKCTLYAKGS